MRDIFWAARFSFVSLKNMEALLGFPLSLAFALIPIYLYRPEFNRRLWLSGTLVITALFFFLPWRLRIEAFMPGGAAIFFLISGIWVVALNPTSSIFKLLNMPLPSRKELKAEIEKIPDAEGRVQKYLALTLQLKKIWQGFFLPVQQTFPASDVMQKNSRD